MLHFVTRTKEIEIVQKGPAKIEKARATEGDQTAECVRNRIGMENV